MKLKYILIFLIPIILKASLFDFLDISEGEKAYDDKNYTKAVKAYQNIENKNDEAKYNLANSYYKQKNYKKAKELYEQTQEDKLSYRKWHNIGNCEANLGNIDAGIKAYEKALKIKNDKDTKYNLELLKKRKKEKEKEKEKKEKENKQKKDSDKNSKKDESKNKNSKDKNSKKNQKQKDENQQKKEDKKSQQKENKMKESKPKKDEHEDKKQDIKAQQQTAKKEPISDKEVKKYLQILDKRGVNTLLLPLKSKGETDEEIKPW